ncbi:MAG: rod shape-determining protein RodA [Caldilineae bacterium]|nr:MAG: rod shape-determining protein RodA [Caldilineae bacterium]
MIRFNWRSFDWLLLVAILMLSIYGVVMINSAVQGDPELTNYPQRQIFYIVAGLVLMFAVAAFDYKFLSFLTEPFYLLVILLLGLVGVLGNRIFGAQSWIDVFGLFPIQPSELAKVALALAMGKYLAYHLDQMDRLRTVLIALLIMLPLLVMVFLEPDLGGAIVLAVEGVFILIAAGLRVQHMVLGVVAGLGLFPFFWGLLQEHQRTRLLIFINPTADPDSYFNVNQALISVGSGGLLGKGYGQGTQSQLHFLRVRHTDFIFSVIAEELGFVGAVGLLLLLFFVLMRLWRIADRARDPFGSFIVVAIAGIVLFQTVVNVGMNMALVPVTGLPLPFVSYGGNAMLSIMMLVGLAESVAMHHRKIEF